MDRDRQTPGGQLQRCCHPWRSFQSNLALARQWQALGEAMAGGEAQIQAGLRRAFQEEPQLMRATACPVHHPTL